MRGQIVANGMPGHHRAPTIEPARTSGLSASGAEAIADSLHDEPAKSAI